MPATPHIEKNFTSSETVRDVVIGMADGLTVPLSFRITDHVGGAALAYRASRQGCLCHIRQQLSRITHGTSFMPVRTENTNR
jgi:hypothetical protein